VIANPTDSTNFDIMDNLFDSDEKTINDIAQLIRTKRKSLNLTQLDFQSFYDICKNTIYRVETGENYTLKQLLKIAKVLNIRIVVENEYPLSTITFPVHEVFSPISKPSSTTIFPVHDPPFLLERETNKQSILDSILESKISDLKLLGCNYDFSKFKYNGDRLEKSIGICSEHGEFKTNLRAITDFLDGKSDGLVCKKCRNLHQSITLIKKRYNVKTHKELILKLIEENKYLSNVDVGMITIDEEISTSKPINFFCKKHGIFTRNLETLMRSNDSGCPDCSAEDGVYGRRTYSIEKLREIAKEKNATCLAEHYLGVHGKHKFRCENGNIFYFSLKQYKRNGTWCKCYKCSPNNRKSSGEDKIASFLKRIGYNYECEKRFNDLKNKSFDFYLPQFNLIVEYDGLQHFQEVEYYGSKNGFRTRKSNDDIKNQFCLSNKIKLLRIPHTEHQNIDKILGEYFADINNQKDILFADEEYYKNNLDYLYS